MGHRNGCDGSVRADRVTEPVYIIGGWSDETEWVGYDICCSCGLISQRVDPWEVEQIVEDHFSFVGKDDES